ncbi:type I-E CRISPR-associated protein Cse2/CasB [Roseomonas gilardii subsp. gilardii]|uniref:type I-E CRISPR-associated protein Cse2/CasB n=1 Tax=Roseomonas gilardii TaxID=257708 RepID=UPI001FFAFB56|nr:type I-E CRISPR-associated protein Cse2/CasB [Roseomonas gilardii]UPG72833.1 type I-E CRISPR-associated protein Cse2/CasB [Roseomonas gilardii subsp. gilardii]
MTRDEKVSAATAWWRDLQPDPPRRAGDRGALARLRRCGSVADAMNETATIDLARRCDVRHPDALVEVALTAAVLAHLREDRPGMTVARQIGPQGGPEALETALMKPLRFQRLMTAVTPDERLAAMRRLVALAGGALNLRDLSAALLDWTEDRRRRWTYDYWGVGQPAARTPMTAPNKDDAA